MHDPDTVPAPPQALPANGGEDAMAVSMQAFEGALNAGEQVRQELLQVSNLVSRGINPGHIRTGRGDLPRLLALATAIEEQYSKRKSASPWRPTRRVQV